MSRVRTLLASDVAPMAWISAAFFAYAAMAAMAVQLVLLPHLFPAWHAGHGLLHGGDWLEFHRLGVECANRIGETGWGGWELRPNGQAPAGIACALYVLISPEPWTLIPFNAVLHAAAGLALVRIFMVLSLTLRQALACAIPFVVFPSALTWVAQIHKDGISIAGSMIALYGWVSLVQEKTLTEGWKRALRSGLWVLLGTAIVWVVRPYQVQMGQGLGIVLAVFLTCIMAVRAMTGRAAWRPAGAVVVTAWLAVLAMTPMTREGIWYEPRKSRSGAAVRIPESPRGSVPKGFPHAIRWERSSWLPAPVDNKLYALALSRDQFRAKYPGAGTNIDAHVDLRSASEVLRYAPRSAQIALFSPFPQHWFGRGSLPANSVMRRVSGMEMAVVYVALVLVPFVLWRGRARFETWVALLYPAAMMTAFALVIPNVGALHRIRYGYMMVLVGLGIAGGFLVYQRLTARKRSGAPGPGSDARAGTIR